MATRAFNVRWGRVIIRLFPRSPVASWKTIAPKLSGVRRYPRVSLWMSLCSGVIGSKAASRVTRWSLKVLPSARKIGRSSLLFRRTQLNLSTQVNFGPWRRPNKLWGHSSMILRLPSVRSACRSRRVIFIKSLLLPLANVGPLTRLIITGNLRKLLGRCFGNTGVRSSLR